MPPQSMLRVVSGSPAPSQAPSRTSLKPASIRQASKFARRVVARVNRLQVAALFGMGGGAAAGAGDILESCPEYQGRVASVKERRHSSLWAGYGSITQVTVQLDDGSTEKMILKTVDPPDDRGVGHERKVASYLVEAAFYRDHAAKLIEFGVAVPRPIAIETEGNRVRFLLSDLTSSHPHNNAGFDDTQANAALEWLASFHAYFFEKPLPPGLQPQGSYWYLDTRMEEFGSIGREWARLKAAGPAIDRRAKGLGPGGARSGAFRTVLHGDFKAANILHSPGDAACAAYDFQYCGESYGARDVAYLLASSVDSRVAGAEEKMLRHYHGALQGHLRRRGLAGRADAYTYEKVVMHYEICLLDYVRFMAGWGFWGNSRYAESRAREILDRLDGGRAGLGEAEYEAAIYKEFPLD